LLIDDAKPVHTHFEILIVGFLIEQVLVENHGDGWKFQADDSKGNKKRVKLLKSQIIQLSVTVLPLFVKLMKIVQYFSKTTSW